MSYFRLLYLSAVVIGASVVVSACGFRPMYGGQPGQIATAELAAIKIEPISGRIGQFLHNQLLDRLTPMGRPASPDYLLTVNLKEGIEGLAVRKNTFATRANLSMAANFSLYEAKSKPNKILFSGKSEIVSSYNIFNSNFATLIAEKEARNRAVLEIGKDISVRLTVFMEQHQNSRNRAAKGPPGK